MGPAPRSVRSLPSRSFGGEEDGGGYGPDEGGDGGLAGCVSSGEELGDEGSGEGVVGGVQHHHEQDAAAAGQEEERDDDVRGDDQEQVPPGDEAAEHQG